MLNLTLSAYRDPEILNFWSLYALRGDILDKHWEKHFGLFYGTFYFGLVPYSLGTWITCVLFPGCKDRLEAPQKKITRTVYVQWMWRKNQQACEPHSLWARSYLCAGDRLDFGRINDSIAFSLMWDIWIFFLCQISLMIFVLFMGYLFRGSHVNF